MAISVNYILEQEKLRKQEDQAHPLAAPQDKQEAQVPLQQNYEQEQAVEEQLAEAPKPPRPTGFEDYDDGQYEAMSTFMTPEQMQAIGSKDPSAFMDNMQQRIYENSARQPTDPYQDEGYKKSRKFAAIGDVLGLASQVAGAAMGADTKERTFEQSSMGRLTANQQNLYNRYLQESDRYSRGLVNAQMQDYTQGKRDWKDTQALLNKTLSDYNKEQIASAKEAQRIKETESRSAKQEEQFNTRIEQTERRMDIQENQQNKRNAATNRREDRLDRQYDYKIDPDNKINEKIGPHIVVPAHPDDPNATVDEFGTRISVVPLSNERKTTYGKEAIANAEFMERHPEYALPYDKTAHSSTQLRDLGEVYVEELYNKQFEQSSPIASPSAGVNAGAAAGAIGTPDRTPSPTTHNTSNQESAEELFPIVL